jgi:hypothetical protein
MQLPPGWRPLTPWDAESRTEEWGTGQIGDLLRIRSFEVPAGRSDERLVLDIVGSFGECTTAPIAPERTELGGEQAFQVQYRCGVTRYSEIVTAHAGWIYIVSVESPDADQTLRTIAEVVRTFEFAD